MKYNPDTVPSNTSIKYHLFDIYVLENQVGSYDLFVLSKLMFLNVRPYQIHYILSDAYGRTESLNSHMTQNIVI